MELCSQRAAELCSQQAEERPNQQQVGAVAPAVVHRRARKLHADRIGTSAARGPVVSRVSVVSVVSVVSMISVVQPGGVGMGGCLTPALYVLQYMF